MVPLRHVTFTINVLGDASIAPLGLQRTFTQDFVDLRVALKLLLSESIGSNLPSGWKAGGEQLTQTHFQLPGTAGQLRHKFARQPAQLMTRKGDSSCTSRFHRQIWR